MAERVTAETKTAPAGLRLADALQQWQGDFKAGPVALIFDEDGVMLSETVAHHLRLGFAAVWVFGRNPVVGTHPRPVRFVPEPAANPAALAAAVSRASAKAGGGWLYWGYNAEFLMFPFCETRRIADLTAFLREERRDAALAYAIDLYAGQSGTETPGVSMVDAWMDGQGYYAASRPDPKNHGYPKERQLDFFGGLGWRFEEHVAPLDRRIDRGALFRSGRRVALQPDRTLTPDALNTFACAWHHSPTVCVLSFRRAKALCQLPAVTLPDNGFRWAGSVRCDWTSRQLLELGFMEPGQWF